MKCYLKYKNLKVLEFELIPCINSVLTTKTKILCSEAIPLPLKDIVEGKQLDGALMNWLSRRKIPNSRFELDDMFIKLYELPEHQYGRMFEYQYVALLLSHYTSEFDNYYIDVDDVDFLFFGYQDPHFIRLYIYGPYKDLIKKDNSNEIDNFIKNNYQTSVMNFKTNALTIPSSKPSWWEYKNDKKILYQRISSEKTKQEAQIFKRIINKYYPELNISINDDLLAIDYSKYINIDSYWLIDFLDKIVVVPNSDITNTIIDYYPEYKNEINILQNIYRELKENNIHLDFFYTTGIARKDNENKLIFIF